MTRASVAGRSSLCSSPEGDSFFVNLTEQRRVVVLGLFTSRPTGNGRSQRSGVGSSSGRKAATSVCGCSHTLGALSSSNTDMRSCSSCTCPTTPLTVCKELRPQHIAIVFMLHYVFKQEVRMSTRTVSQIQEIPLQSLVEDDGNVRTRLTGIEELAESLKSMGQLQPIVVVETGSRDLPYRVVAGHRRVAAARLAGIETLLATIVAVDAPEARAMQLVENIQREDLPALDVAEALRQMLAFEASPDALAKRVSKPVNWVRRHLALVKLDAEVVQAIRKNRLGFAQAEEIARLAKNVSVTEAVACASKARDGKLSMLDLREMSKARVGKEQAGPRRYAASGKDYEVILTVKTKRTIDEVTEGQLRSIVAAVENVLEREVGG